MFVSVLTCVCVHDCVRVCLCLLVFLFEFVLCLWLFEYVFTFLFLLVNGDGFPNSDCRVFRNPGQ